MVGVLGASRLVVGHDGLDLEGDKPGIKGTLTNADPLGALGEQRRDGGRAVDLQGFTHAQVRLDKPIKTTDKKKLKNYFEKLKN